MLSHKTVLATILVCASLAASAAMAAERQINTVIELFTSQGCSSCPPADELLEQYSKRPDVVALSYSVDYWDYQGWKDTLASHEFTERQKAYAASRGDRQVYTPQVVVNGQLPAVGSNARAVEEAIERSAKPFVPIEVAMNGDAVSVSVGKADERPARKATLWLVLYDRHAQVPIGRGENRDKTLDYYNVVRRMQPVAMWRGEPIKVDLPMNKYHQGDADGCALILQEESPGGGAGPIIGAARIESPAGSW